LKCEKLTDERRRTTSDGKSSLCLWQGELKTLPVQQELLTAQTEAINRMTDKTMSSIKVKRDKKTNNDLQNTTQKTKE
jgi:hypothetical protein